MEINISIFSVYRTDQEEISKRLPLRIFFLFSKRNCHNVTKLPSCTKVWQVQKTPESRGQELSFLIVPHCLIKRNMCGKFHENIPEGLRVITQTTNVTEPQKFERTANIRG